MSGDGTVLIGDHVRYPRVMRMLEDRVSAAGTMRELLELLDLATWVLEEGAR